MSALVKIRSERDRMSAIERRIADFVLDNAQLLRERFAGIIEDPGRALRIPPGCRKTRIADDHPAACARLVAELDPREPGFLLVAGAQ